MRHAAGQPAESLHLLRVAELLFEPAPIRDVEGDAEEVRLLADEDPQGREQHRRQGAVAGPDVPFERAVAGREHFAHLAHERRLLVGGDERQHVEARDLVAAVAGEALEGGVPPHQHAPLVDERDQAGEALEHRFRELALLLKLRFRLAVPDDVREDVGDALQEQALVFAERMWGLGVGGEDAVGSAMPLDGHVQARDRLAVADDGRVPDAGIDPDADRAAIRAQDVADHVDRGRHQHRQVARLESEHAQSRHRLLLPQPALHFVLGAPAFRDVDGRGQDLDDGA